MIATSGPSSPVLHPPQVEEEFLAVWGRFSAEGADVSSDEESSEDPPDMAAVTALDHVKAGEIRNQGPIRFTPCALRTFQLHTQSVDLAESYRHTTCFWCC